MILFLSRNQIADMGGRSIANGLKKNSTLTELMLNKNNINNQTKELDEYNELLKMNDEMETLALNSLGLEQVPTNSFKGYFGHTLGASGIMELVLSLESMKNNELIKSLGYENHGVSKALNVIQENQLDTLLIKTILPALTLILHSLRTI